MSAINDNSVSLRDLNFGAEFKGSYRHRMIVDLERLAYPVFDDHVTEHAHLIKRLHQRSGTNEKLLAATPVDREVRYIRLRHNGNGAPGFVFFDQKNRPSVRAWVWILLEDKVEAVPAAGLFDGTALAWGL